MRRIIMGQGGETIVEVLMAAAIIGLSIGLAYGVGNRSLKTARQSQERTEAVKFAEGQTEQLKALSYEDSSHDQGIFNVGQTYCLNRGRKKVSTGLNMGSLAADSLTQYNPNCVNGLHHIAVTYSNDNNFTVYVRWFGIGQLKKEEVKINYRLYAE